jgi:hypothetical protein
MINIQKRQEVVKKISIEVPQPNIFAKISLFYCGINPNENP